MALIIQPDGEAAREPRADCGRSTRTVSGFVIDTTGPRAFYLIRWTDGHRERGAQLMVSIGAWREGSRVEDRRCFGIECSMGVDRASFAIVDAANSPWAYQEFLGEKLSRDAALADPLEPEILAILDRLADDDPGFRAFLIGGQFMTPWPHQTLPPPGRCIAHGRPTAAEAPPRNPTRSRASIGRVAGELSGQTVEAMVSRVDEYGVFAVVGDATILTLIVDICDEPVRDLRARFQPGDRVRVRVLFFIPERDIYKGTARIPGCCATAAAALRCADDSAG